MDYLIFNEHYNSGAFWTWNYSRNILFTNIGLDLFINLNGIKCVTFINGMLFMHENSHEKCINLVTNRRAFCILDVEAAIEIKLLC